MIQLESACHEAGTLICIWIQGGGTQVNFSSKVVGGAGGKTDFVMTFGLDFS